MNTKNKSIMGVSITLIITIIAIASITIVYFYGGISPPVDDGYPLYVCGDGTCDPGENEVNCPNDCAPPQEAPMADPGGPYSGITGEDSILLDGSGSTDPDGTIELYEWDLNEDGIYTDAIGETKTIEIADFWLTAGTYTIALKVTDDDGNSDMSTTEIIVSEIDLCGNGVLDAGENCQTCPQDAGGACQPDVTSGLGFRRPLVPVNLNDNFYMTVYVVPTGDQNIDSFILDVNYDSTKLEYVSHSPLNSWDSWWYAGDVTTGTITDAQSFKPAGQENKGNLFRIKFKAIATGSAALSFDNIEITDVVNDVITIPDTSNTITIN